jgi:electron transfer flavoprotein alpha subunit
VKTSRYRLRRASAGRAQTAGDAASANSDPTTYDAIVAPATSRFKNVMPRVAALLDVMQVSEIIKVVAPSTFERPIYAGNAIERPSAGNCRWLRRGGLTSERETSGCRQFL